MKRLYDWLLYLIIALAGLCIVTPILYWFRHPELTQMQMLMDTWPLYCVALVLIGIVGWRLDRHT